MKEKYKSWIYRTSTFTLEQLSTVLKEKVHDNQLVQITIQIEGGDGKDSYHANGLFKQGEYYYYYEPNDSNGEYKDTSIEKIAKIIFNKYHNSKNVFKMREMYIYYFSKSY